MAYKDPKRQKEAHRMWQARNQEKVNEYHKKYRQEHPNKVRKWTKHNTETVKKRYRLLRKQILEKLGNKCIKCGFSDFRALQIDHVNAGGKKERATFYNDTAYYLAVLADETGKYQLLCANCNWIKIHENKENYILV